MASVISEKVAEILFNRHMLQWLGLGNAQLFAPTTRAEFKAGYDAKVVGVKSMRELYLQFKAPSFSERDQRFSFDLTPHQHTRLLKYPEGSAYYVAPHFTSLTHLNEVQDLVKSTEDFLRYYVCFDVSALSADARSVTFRSPPNHRHTVEPGYKDSRHSKSPRDFAKITARHWERGNLLVEKLKRGEAGRMVHLEAPSMGTELSRQEDTSLPYIVLPERKDCPSLGTFIRVFPGREVAA